jgi:hypothetical protein
MGRLVIHCTMTGEDLMHDAETCPEAFTAHDAELMEHISSASTTIKHVEHIPGTGMIGTCRTWMSEAGVTTEIHSPFTFYDAAAVPRLHTQA